MATLRIEESRYERLEQISWWLQPALRRSQIFVAGAGALGNEILKHLALLGIGRIVVIDFDHIEISNLSRSIFFRASDAGSAKADVIAARLMELNPDVRVLPIIGDLTADVGLGLLRRMDVVLAGLDSVGSRRELNRMCWLAGVPWIDGAVAELDGTVRVFAPPDGACFECGMSESDYRQLKVRHACQPLPAERDRGTAVPTSPTSASVIAAWQVQEALKYLHGRPMLSSQGVSCFGNSYEFWKPRYERRDDCPGHERLGDIVELPEATSRMTVAELLTVVAARWGDGTSVELDREVVRGVRCMSCGRQQSIVRAFGTLRYDEILCPRCGAEGDPQLTHRLNGSPTTAALADVSLSALGVPPLHVLAARVPGSGTRYFELTGDAAGAPFAGFLRQEEEHERP